MTNLNKKEEFWVMNITNRNIMLSDLSLNIPAKRFYNLLDSKHFYYTKEQLEKSLKEGSLYKKSDKIKKCEAKPKFMAPARKKLSEQPMQMRKRSAVKVTTPQYEELIISDEKYAEEMSELFAETDE
jgi:hypothetical protein